MRLLVLACLLVVAPATAQRHADVTEGRQPEWRQAREERVNVDLGAFRPGIIRLSAGMPTRMVFYNSSPTRLGVAGGGLFAASRLRSGDEGIAMRGGFTVRPGEAREVVLVPAAGRYRLRSTSIYRRLLGMSALVIVE